MAKDTSPAGTFGSILKKRYILTFTIIAALIIMSQIIIQFLISRGDYDSRVINIAGRQRMLSQKISKDVLGLYFSEDNVLKKDYLDELSFSVDLFKESHISLKYGNSYMGLPGKNSQKVSQMYMNIEDNYIHIIDASNKIIGIVQRQEYDSKTLKPYINIIRENEVPFLEGMDEIVFQLDAESKSKIATIKYIELVICLITLIVLYLEQKFILKPAISEIDMTFGEMLENEKVLERHATFDAMTGLLNKRSGINILSELIKKAKKDAHDLTLVFIDLDHLKNVNDTHGHGEGDWYIKTIAFIIGENIRSKDYAFRYGGDEIVIILDYCDYSKAKILMNRIDKAVKAIENTFNKPYKTSISYGIADAASVDSESPEQLIKRADSLMYEHKNIKKETGNLSK